MTSGVAKITGAKSDLLYGAAVNNLLFLDIMTIREIVAWLDIQCLTLGIREV